MKLRAFETLQPPPLIIEIDASALQSIKDCAHRIYLETKVPSQVPCILQALHDYILARGLTPNFKVIK